MVYSQWNIQKLLGEKENILLGDLVRIKNGPIDCGISFFITGDAMTYWLRKFNLDRRAIITSGKSKEFTQKYYERFYILLKTNIEHLIASYGAFPSMEFPAQNIAFVFEVSDRPASCRTMTQNFEIIQITLNIESLLLSDLQLSNFIKHELFHIIAKLKEGQDYVKASVEELQKKFSDQISKDRAIVDNSVQDLAKY